VNRLRRAAEHDAGEQYAEQQPSVNHLALSILRCSGDTP
jgi:hypothetical protein